MSQIVQLSEKLWCMIERCRQIFGHLITLYFSIPLITEQRPELFRLSVWVNRDPS